MTIERLQPDFTVCRLSTADGLNLNREFWFFARTDGELSLVCPSGEVPPQAALRDDGWRAFRVAGPLEFSMVGVLATISGALAAAGISLFAVSTYDTDYILVKRERFDDALAALADAGFTLQE